MLSRATDGVTRIRVLLESTLSLLAGGFKALLKGTLPGERVLARVSERSLDL